MGPAIPLKNYILITYWNFELFCIYRDLFFLRTQSSLFFFKKGKKTCRGKKFNLKEITHLMGLAEWHR